MVLASARRIESFEGQHFDDWSEDTGSFAFETTDVGHGSAALDSEAGVGPRSIRGTGLRHAFSRGQTIRFMFKPVNGDEVCRFYFFYGSSDDRYYLVLDADGSIVRLWKTTTGSTSNLTAQIACAWITGDYHTVEIDTTDTANDRIAFEVWNESGTSLATGSADDADHDSGDIRINHNGQSASTRSLWDHLRLTQM